MGGFFLGQSRCPETEAAIPHPGIEDTYGCPLKNSAETNTHVLKNLQYPPPRVPKALVVKASTNIYYYYYYVPNNTKKPILKVFLKQTNLITVCDKVPIV